MRRWLAIACNLLVPGSGLVLLQREWLGCTLALIFALFGTLGMWAVFITPASVPTGTATVALLVAAAAWLIAQIVLRRRLAAFRDPAVLDEVRRLRAEAGQRAADADYEAAFKLLRVALTLDDEDLETNVQLAETLTLLGRLRPARQAWRRVERLDRAGLYRRHVAVALDRLPAR